MPDGAVKIKDMGLAVAAINSALNVVESVDWTWCIRQIDEALRRAVLPPELDRTVLSRNRKALTAARTFCRALDAIAAEYEADHRVT